MFILAAFESTAERLRSTVTDGLILKIGKGDMDAFHALYEAAHSSVYGFALSIVKNTHDAQDVLQDTFIAVHENAVGYLPQGKPMAWILSITKNFALGKLRKNAKEPLAEEFIIENERAIDDIANLEQREAIKAMLAVLDDEEREIVMLHAAAGFKNREIADLLGLKLSTVLSKYHRAIKKLEKSVEEE